MITYILFTLYGMFQLTYLQLSLCQSIIYSLALINIDLRLFSKNNCRLWSPKWHKTTIYSCHPLPHNSYVYMIVIKSNRESLKIMCNFKICLVLYLKQTCFSPLQIQIEKNIKLDYKLNGCKILILLTGSIGPQEASSNHVEFSNLRWKCAIIDQHLVVITEDKFC